MFSIFTSQILYVKIKENLLIIKSIKSGKTITLKANKPFSSKRLLVADFNIPQKLLEKAFSELNGRSLIEPIVIMHPFDKNYEKLAPIERKILSELALEAGAKKVFLYEGRELIDEDIMSFINSKKIIYEE